jgi:hypothetical protein
MNKQTCKEQCDLLMIGFVIAFLSIAAAIYFG